MKSLSYLLVIVTLILSACTPATLAPTPKRLTADTPFPSSTPTMTATPSQIPTITATATLVATATLTATTTPTLDPVTAAKIEAMRAAVGDKVEDWIKEITPEFSGAPEGLHLIQVKLVLARENEEIKGKQIFDGNGKPVGEVEIAFEGEYLIGDQVKKVTFPYFMKNLVTGNCFFYPQPGDWDCKLLLKNNVKWNAKNTVFQKGAGGIAADGFGQVISVFLLPLDSNKDPWKGMPSIPFNNNYLTGSNLDLYQQFLTKGDDEIGFIVPFMNQSACIPADQKRLGVLCQQDGEPKIIIPGY